MLGTIISSNSLPIQIELLINPVPLLKVFDHEFLKKADVYHVKHCHDLT
jgi:hypothetical protein